MAVDADRDMTSKGSPHMGVSLSKGGNVSLTKAAPNLTAVAVGLGWDVRTTTGTEFDLDASAIAVGTDKKVVSDKHFVFYNNPRSPEGAIEHTGDNTTGEGEGDDEVINVDLAAVPPNIDAVVFPAVADVGAAQQRAAAHPTGDRECGADSNQKRREGHQVAGVESGQGQGREFAADLGAGHDDPPGRRAVQAVAGVLRRDGDLVGAGAQRDRRAARL